MIHTSRTIFIKIKTTVLTISTKIWNNFQSVHFKTMKLIIYCPQNKYESVK